MLFSKQSPLLWHKNLGLSIDTPKLLKTHALWIFCYIPMQNAPCKPWRHDQGDPYFNVCLPMHCRIIVSFAYATHETPVNSTLTFPSMSHAT